MIKADTPTREKRPERPKRKKKDAATAEPASAEIAPPAAPVETGYAMTAPTDFQNYTEADKAHQVLTWILEGKSKHNICKTFEVAFPGEDAQSLIAAAWDHIWDASDIDINEIDGWILLSLQLLYERAAAIGDFSGAKAILREIRQVAHSIAESD